MIDSAIELSTHICESCGSLGVALVIFALGVVGVAAFKIKAPGTEVSANEEAAPTRERAARDDSTPA